jgi:hypothetical protein
VVLPGTPTGGPFGKHHLLEELAADKAYEFAWSFNPVPIKGATGSPGNSVAIA